MGARGRVRSSDKPGSSQEGPSSAEGEAPAPPQAFSFHPAPPRSGSTDSSPSSSNKGKSPQGIVPVTGKPLPIGNIGKKGISRKQRKASIAAASSSGSRDDSPQSGIMFGSNRITFYKILSCVMLDLLDLDTIFWYTHHRC